MLYKVHKTLSREFFERNTLEVAKDLLGKILVFQEHQGIINEIEAYIGMDDAACHASIGKTKRNAVMFGKAGFSYVYLIYGMYYCLNIVTEQEDFPAAILIRGVRLFNGILLNGPGKLCSKLGINKSHNNIDMIHNRDFTVLENDLKISILQTPRIGISKAKDKMWRFIIE